MCGRYTLAVQLDLIADRFASAAEFTKLAPRFNIAPGQLAPVVVNTDNQRQLRMMKWGLVPSWAKEESIGYKMINARAETLGEKPSFKQALEQRRCIVPADGFYEWRKEPDGKSKTPMRIELKDRSLFGFAGLWERWRKPDGDELLTYTIVTTTPNALLETVHNRMPVILTKEAERLWLGTDVKDMLSITALLKPFPADQMEMFPVSREVNNPRTDSPICIEPAGN
jgi:putative SOS response-associated peptidase YedK